MSSVLAAGGNFILLLFVVSSYQALSLAFLLVSPGGHSDSFLAHGFLKLSGGAFLPMLLSSFPRASVRSTLLDHEDGRHYILSVIDVSAFAAPTDASALLTLSVHQFTP